MGGHGLTCRGVLAKAVLVASLLALAFSSPAMAIHGQQTLVSTGTTSGCNYGVPPECDGNFGGATPTGSIMVFVTPEQLLPEDTDNNQDVYARSGNVTTLISTGPN